jgi:hypothetical protein
MLERSEASQGGGEFYHPSLRFFVVPMNRDSSRMTSSDNLDLPARARQAGASQGGNNELKGAIIYLFLGLLLNAVITGR